MEHYLARQVLRGDGDSPERPEIAHRLGQRQYDLFGERPEPSEGELLRHQALEPLAVERLHRFQ